jgi:hypothetical protein
MRPLHLSRHKVKPASCGRRVNTRLSRSFERKVENKNSRENRTRFALSLRPKMDKKEEKKVKASSLSSTSLARHSHTETVETGRVRLRASRGIRPLRAVHRIASRARTNASGEENIHKPKLAEKKLEAFYQEGGKQLSRAHVLASGKGVRVSKTAGRLRSRKRGAKTKKRETG